jgi:hypothetical protein
MEIQSFILCKEVTCAGVGNMSNGRLLGITTVFPIGAQYYPLEFDMEFYMLLRRDHSTYDENFSLRFDLVDQDGNSTGQPTGFKFL